MGRKPASNYPAVSKEDIARLTLASATLPDVTDGSGAGAARRTATANAELEEDHQVITS